MTDMEYAKEHVKQHANGQAPPAEEIRVRFGPRPNQVVPLEWAETMLTELKRINPGLFGKLLVMAAGHD